MSDVLRKPDTARAADALAASAAAFGALLAMRPGATWHEESGVRWVDTGIPDATFNGVYHVQRADGDHDSAVSRVVAHFRHRGLPFHWQVCSPPEATRAGAVLQSHGLRHDETEPGMWLDLGSLPEPPAATPDLDIRPVTDHELLRLWIDVWGCGAPRAVTELWYQVYSALPFGPDGVLRMFIGFRNGEPVATVYLFLAAGVAAVHYVVTRPEFRRRGFGAAMTDHAVREARDAGYRVAVLTASAMGHDMYRRIGFGHCSVVANYECHPSA